MAKIRILTCSETGIPKDLARELGIVFLPYYVTYLGESVSELEMDAVEFYRSMRATLQMATTSHPTLEDYLRVFGEEGKDGSELIYVALSSAYSKAFDVATLGRERLPEVKLTIVDTRAGTAGHALVALEAARAVQEGKGSREVRAQIDRTMERSNCLLILDTLKYLARGGRIHKARSFLGSILKIRPVFSFDEEGMTIRVGRVRTASQGLGLVLKTIRADMDRVKCEKIHVVVEDADNREWADQVTERIVQEFSPEELWRWTISPIVGAHVGPGTWGVAYYCL